VRASLPGKQAHRLNGWKTQVRRSVDERWCSRSSISNFPDMLFQEEEEIFVIVVEVASAFVCLVARRQLMRTFAGSEDR
jgi:hypothetical protein